MCALPLGGDGAATATAATAATATAATAATAANGTAARVCGVLTSFLPSCRQQMAREPQGKAECRDLACWGGGGGAVMGVR